MEENKQQIEHPNSCEISINAKGLYSGKVKVYAKTIEEAYSLAIERSTKLEELIRKKNGG
jgi:ATP sulfurylase